MKLSELLVGDAVVISGFVDYGTNRERLGEITKVLSDSLEVQESGSIYRFSKKSGEQKQPNISGQWATFGVLKISVPTLEQMQTLPGYKGNSKATAIRQANEQMIENFLNAAREFLDQDSPAFPERLERLQAALDNLPQHEPLTESYSDTITRLEIENRDLKNKLDSIQAILNK
ncbi:hypothetical protein Q2T42_25620 [Leptolyngbya boryana CZ1]|uniref:Uncharacterized protein n=1 Tax=Leptolyngbya boryana CZ1 TaxID=3060204 RepID=A0AA96X442_LEPBY|nr:hypothetical protein [Leptolyngbya boryana]WNZ45170.1 hypothetical protein Q2T42_25620 [Leptolyngbya boryana CZ1]